LFNLGIMNKYHLILLIVLLIFQSCKNSPEEIDGLKDIDGNVYTTIQINEDVWSTENSRVLKFRNGDLIPHAETNESWETLYDQEKPAWCYLNNNPENGILYNWYAVNDSRKLAPKGWHVSTSNEFERLIKSFGGKDKAGLKLKTKEGWIENGNGNNESGFSGRPGGLRWYFGKFDLTENGYWWCSDDKSSIHANSLLLVYQKDLVDIVSNNKGTGLSVRFVKD